MNPSRAPHAGGNSIRALAPWAVTALLVGLAAWLTQRTLVDRMQVDLLKVELAFMEVALKSAQQELEAERILNDQLLRQSGKTAAGGAGTSESRPPTAPGAPVP